MVISPTKFLSHLSLLSLFFFISNARSTLDPSNSDALSTILEALGITTQLLPSANPCGIAGVFCERRLSNDNTYVLQVTKLIFKSQRLAGFLSPAIGELSELRELSLSNNRLTGKIPSQIVGCKKLEILDLQGNRFSGEVPSNLSLLTDLRVLDLSSNEFFGSLNFLKFFPNLERIFLANNHFSGKVPQSIRSFRNLQFIDLSGNSFLEGAVPLMNRVEATPSSQYPKRYVLAEKRNSNRIAAEGPSASKASSTAQAPSPSTSAQLEHKGKKWKGRAWIMGFFVGISVGCVLGFIALVLFKLSSAAIKGRGKESSVALYSSLIKKAEDLAFLEKDDGLASLQIIGKGGCGEVYKAELPGSNGKIIAIKKIIQPPMNADELTVEDSKGLNRKMRQIRSEINTVGQIRHKNLLPLMAHVPRPDCHYLVYEFMKNGSLQDALNDVRDGRRELDWLTRHKVALGVAAGLEYLHLQHSPRIIHRDLKPANVLLDDDMEAKIADFGLAKAMPDAHTHITTSNVAGTIGFIAPEYHQTLKFTDKCDIYSFGVLLGVLVIGKLPSDEFFQHTDELGLVKWMRNVMTSENPSGAIDPKLMVNGYAEQMLLVLKIACFCTLDNPKERPNSKDVRCMLSQIRQ